MLTGLPDAGDAAIEDRGPRSCRATGAGCGWLARGPQEKALSLWLAAAGALKRKTLAS